MYMVSFHFELYNNSVTRFESVIAALVNRAPLRNFQFVSLALRCLGREVFDSGTEFEAQITRPNKNCY